MQTGSRPWWADDPEILAIRRRVDEEVESWSREPLLSEEPDPVVLDFYSGASLHELAEARDDLERARARYADAVRAARTVGLSWGEIGRVLGVSKQVLHRRFSRVGQSDLCAELVLIGKGRANAEIGVELGISRVRELLASGNKIAAIKAYRDENNVDLPTATRMIESL